MGATLTDTIDLFISGSPVGTLNLVWLWILLCYIAGHTACIHVEDKYDATRWNCTVARLVDNAAERTIINGNLGKIKVGHCTGVIPVLCGHHPCRMWDA
ncbi:hypothetical protein BR93DRAFT_218067 [Coniochaeta sp. PMI_546]|nr:hypothetical protein BR93DRAFT_218067 [Coniochaeta sp. PMI_546]